MNISEGTDRRVVDAVASAAGRCLLDVHTDRHHNRAVLTMAGTGVEAAVRAVAAEAVRRIDMRLHTGVHPRLGAVDVVPFVPLGRTTLEDALAARGRFADWAATELGVPCFLYGPERTLPDVRRRAFAGLMPDRGPMAPHPTAGAMCVGARPVLVAFNVWLAEGTDPATARSVARAIRSPELRALGLDVGGAAQVSMNLVDPLVIGPADAYDAVARLAPVARAEVVGMVPRAVLLAIPVERWAELDLGEAKALPG